jgi:hypothetical protein
VEVGDSAPFAVVFVKFAAILFLLIIIVIDYVLLRLENKFFQVHTLRGAQNQPHRASVATVSGVPQDQPALKCA